MVELIPMTHGPRYHWFGYYDKLQFDPTGRYVLGMSVDFQHRSPRADDRIVVGMIDREDGNRWIDLASSTAWCWQQGCMLQWLPGSQTEVIFNDREDGRLCARTLDVRTGSARTIGRPIYSVAPDGRNAVGIDHLRTGWLRPGYGYVGEDPTAAEKYPAGGGIYHIDLASGASRLIISIAEIVERFPVTRVDAAGMYHWFNHLLVSPGGSRFIFLHRCRTMDQAYAATTRMFTADLDGGEIRLVDDHGGMSHFIWRDEESILGWATRPPRGDAFYLFDEGTGKAEIVGDARMPRNGHCSYLPGNGWILNDTYPIGKDRRFQELYLYRPQTDTRIDLARLEAPPEFTGEWRCDLHPRSSRDGTLVCIDSPDSGGRQMYCLDISGIV